MARPALERGGVRARSALAALAAVLCAPAAAQRTARIAASAAEPDNLSVAPSLSADGRRVAFETYATNLAAGDANAIADVQVWDEAAGLLVASVSSAGVAGNAASFAPSISPDGRFVAFTSFATNFHAGDVAATANVFVRDLAAGATELVDVPIGPGPHGFSYLACVSAGGGRVAYFSSSQNLVPGDANGAFDVFVRDRAAAATMLASLGPGGVQGDAGSYSPALSADGRSVAFHSSATNLVAGDANGVDDVFVRELESGVTARASVATGGAEADGPSHTASISADGRRVLFLSAASNLAPGTTPGRVNAFLRDRRAGTTRLVSAGISGGDADQDVLDAALSADGRIALLSSAASNLAPGDANGAVDVVRVELASDARELASVGPDGAPGDGASRAYGAAISCDGRRVAFSSAATTLVAGDGNGFEDVFLRDLGAPRAVVYCLARADAAGCAGALESFGEPSASAGSGFVVGARGLAPGTLGLFLLGAGGPALLLQDAGFLCLGTPRAHTRLRAASGASSACGAGIAADLNAELGMLAGLAPGTTLHAQLWTRDAAGTPVLGEAVAFTPGP